MQAVHCHAGEVEPDCFCTRFVVEPVQSRGAGACFITNVLTCEIIPFEKQVVIEAKKRPDFILPSLAFISSGEAIAATGLILSAKTTLRERWKQVEREKGERRLYLTTVDENIAGNAIQDMAGIGVQLVIPESLMDAKETEYAGHKNVLTFRRFCDEVVEPNLAVWG
ncbi:type II restriction endonuclease [Celeribacter naphthalenivorans]|uniref:type II restriction endonuclease n=1 Tax=Celeribacter naphthalenivorans TaxID=1614694 RepID=UPI001CFBD262|nr:type II restriction endonuclease [Celeribacter naphthalenivorans]